MSNNFTHSDAPAAPYYVAKYEDWVVAIKRDESYEVTLRLIQKSIPKLRSADIQNIFISTTLPEYGHALVQIGENIWPDLVERVKDVEITLEQPDHIDYDDSMERRDAIASPDTEHTQKQAAPVQTSDVTATTTTDSSSRIAIDVLSTSQRIFKFNRCSPSATPGELKSYIEAKHGVPAALQTIKCLGKSLQDAATLNQSGVTDGSTLSLGLNTRKTMIYFCPSSRAKDIVFGIKLNRAWELIALKSSAASPPKDYIQTKTWRINITKESMLYDHYSKQTHRYLFWDGL
ncbi:hypothetical protein FRC12_006199 [Ceratobasidium sp. 428]|nr:hypothetical protein FRC12_006199 [Ceratobasidium sp. 428]